MKNNNKDKSKDLPIKTYENMLHIAYHPLSFELHNTLNVSLPDEINQIFLKSCDLRNNLQHGSPYYIVKNREKKNDVDYFYALLHMGVQDGMCAVLYNLNTFIELCKYIRNKYSELAKITKMKPNQSMAPSTQILTYEYEHFTIHSKIVLDRLNYTLNYFFQTKDKNLFKLYKTLRNNQSSLDIVQRTLKVIEIHTSFLETMISSTKGKTERDKISHINVIPFTGPNINIWPDGKIYVKLFAPDQTEQNYFKQKEADQILTERFEKLMNFIIEFLNAFFNFK